ncbi:sensor histidine kinase [Pseudobutyrivibrio sp.]|uniref:sensor histidine kinase n=1 Tax=Pseudobutyrivibrio sp. TaxID=2014367 RepID=UPI0025D66201|nr:GHKL domain-containing protein [Pseudobutyrivibrio sp.]MBR5650137.1 sensor histidine kinase [Pseudobutyrivibrio sp.]
MNFFMSLIEFAFLIVEAIWIIKCANLQIKNKRYVAFGFLAAIATSGLLQDKISYGSICLIELFLVYIIVFLIIDSSIVSKIESTVLVLLVNNCLILSVKAFFPDGAYFHIGNKCVDMVLNNLVELSIVFLFGFLAKRFLESLINERRRKVGKFLDYVITIGCLDIFICIFSIYNLIQIAYFKGVFARVVTSIAALSLVLLEINVLYKKWLVEKVQEYAKAERELYETQRNYYISLLDKEAETKKYRHDMNNHMICLKSLIDDENYDELRNYIDKLYDKTSVLVNKGFSIGNTIIDALTNYYAEHLEKDIELRLEGRLMRPILIDDIALSSIYSNMIVNAIEAQKHISSEKKKYIHIHLREGNKYAQLTVRNSMSIERIANVNAIETTKLDKENHGFGINNIRKNVLDNHGDLSIEAKDYEFCVRVTLPLNTKNIEGATVI